MPIASTALLFIAMLLAALLLEPLARLLRLPLSAALVAAGFAGSQLIVAAGYDTGLRWHHFHDLVFYVFLPVLIFEAAFNLKARLLFRNLFPILLLVLPFLLLSTAVTAAILFYAIDHAQGFPWLTALVAGALLAATDPVAVSELARHLPVPERLLTLMEGESLMNDATTIVLFTLLLAAAAPAAPAFQPGTASIEFLRLACGGLLAGLVVGVLSGQLIRWLDRAVIISLLAAFCAYLLAEILFHVSGVMASLACGLWLARTLTGGGTRELQQVSDWWDNLGWIANSGIFLLAGATITLAMFEERWLAMLIGIAAAFLTRALSLWLTGGLSALMPRQQLPRAYQMVMAVGGLRGAVTLALALSLPIELEGWWTVQSIAYGVVLFSLFIQAPAISPLLLHLQKSGRLE